MSLSVEVKINGKTIHEYEAVRVLTHANREDIDPDHVHTYRVRRAGDGIYAYVQHRYGDGAYVLAEKVLEHFHDREVAD